MLEAIVLVAVLVLLARAGPSRSTTGWCACAMLVKEGFSGITVQLRRRADLVPNLVSTVEGYATHEKSVLARSHRPPRRRHYRERRRRHGGRRTMPSPRCSGG